MIHPVILSGGSGTRLWPMSRSLYPKQLLVLTGELSLLQETARRGEFATGLIYIEPDRDDFLTQLNMVDEALATLPLDRVRPGPEALEEIMEGLR